MSRWLVTGATGMLGRELCGELLAQGEDVTGLGHAGLVEVDGDRGRGSWYLIEFNQRAQGDGTLHLGHYDDEYVRTPDGWRFASRAMHMLYRGAMDRGVVVPLPPRAAQRP